MAGGVRKSTPNGATGRRLEAARLLADDRLPDHEIASLVGVSRACLTKWKRQPAFQELINEAKVELDRGMRRLRVAKVRERVKVLDELHDRQLDVIRQRADRYARGQERAVGPGIVLEVDAAFDVAEEAARKTRAMFEVGEGDDAPGVDTGLLVRDVKVVGQGKAQRIVTVWKVDVGLLDSIRAYQEQAARELGQWIDKAEVERRTTTFRVVGVDVGKL